MFDRRRPLALACAVAVLAGCGGPDEAVASHANRSARQDWQTMSLSRRAAGEERLAVELEYGAGKLTVAPGSSDQLYQARMRYDASAFEPVTSYSDGRLQIGVEGGQIRGRKLEAGSLDLQLSPDVALDLELAFGAAEADIELGGLRIESLELSTGASRTSLAFSEPNPIAANTLTLQVGAAQLTAKGLANANARQISVEGGVGDIELDFTGSLSNDIDVSVEMGLGRLVLRIPRGVGVRIDKDGLLAAVKGEGLVQRGDVYYSAEYDSAERRLHFDIDAAFNAIDIVWVDNNLAG